MKINSIRKGFTGIIVIVLVVAVLLSIFLIPALMGSIFGAFSREGTPSDESPVEEPTGPIPPSCNGVVEKAAAYLGRGIRYSQKKPPDHCAGPGIGPDGVLYLDCSGYASRAYRDAGLFSPSLCLNTVGLSHAPSLTKIASDVATARSVAQAGDIILFGLTSSGSKTSNAHAVIYAGSNTAYESGGSGGGPHFAPRNVWGHSRQLYGVYRSTLCGK